MNWQPRAIDGADLPTGRRGFQPAVDLLTIGKILDFDYTPSERGEMVLIVRSGPRGLILGMLPIRVI